MKKWLKSRSYSLKLASFFLMMLLPIALYYAAQANGSFWSILLLGLFSAASLLLILLG